MKGIFVIGWDFDSLGVTLIQLIVWSKTLAMR